MLTNTKRCKPQNLVCAADNRAAHACSLRHEPKTLQQERNLARKNIRRFLFRQRQTYSTSLVLWLPAPRCVTCPAAALCCCRQPPQPVAAGCGGARFLRRMISPPRLPRGRHPSAGPAKMHGVRDVTAILGRSARQSVLGSGKGSTSRHGQSQAASYAYAQLPKACWTSAAQAEPHGTARTLR